MLKINETSFTIAKEQFEISSRVLLKEETMLSQIRKELEGISGLEDQIGWLKKINNDIGQTRFKAAMAIKVLNYAQMQYAGCENAVVSKCPSNMNIATEYYTVKPINVYSSYLKNVKWKEVK